MHCIVLIPDLFTDGAVVQQRASRRRFASIETLAARGRRSLGDWHSTEQHLLELFGVARQASWPSAPYALLGEGHAPGADYWCHADPVHLRADRDRLLAAGPPAVSLSAQEADALADSLNLHFGDGISVRAVHPHRWYARITAPPAGEAAPFRGAAGRILHTDMAPIRWHALMNEFQMVLHEHPVNEEREARGEPAVNGVWLWGGGRLAAATAAPASRVLACNPLALGLARNAGLEAAVLPSNADRWLAEEHAGGRYLFLLDARALRAGAAGPGALDDALEQIDRDWIEPLLGALRRGRIGMLTLRLAGKSQLIESEATGVDLRRIWRRRRPLARYFETLAGARHPDAA